VSPSSNEAKHTSANPVVRALLRRFHAALTRQVREAAPASLLDVGCGEGFVLAELGPLPHGGVVRGVDVSPAAVARCRERAPWAEPQVASVYELPFADGAFDLVICLEVLEHLDRPEAGLRELTRVARRKLVLSVPWEPWFQLGNLAQFKHLAGLGNHPEHVQRWTQRGFGAFLQQAGGLRQVALRSSFPWTIAVCDLEAARGGR
jgi:SAM-dependent methyltransferase